MSQTVKFSSITSPNLNNPVLGEKSLNSSRGAQPKFVDESKANRCLKSTKSHSNLANLTGGAAVQHAVRQ